MPYNYLIDDRIRSNYKINYENSIIVIDEGHNIPKIAEEVASFEINIRLMDMVISELNILLKQMLDQANKLANNELEPFQIKKFKSEHSSVEKFKRFIISLKKRIENFEFAAPDKMRIENLDDRTAVFNGQKIFSVIFDERDEYGVKLEDINIFAGEIQNIISDVSGGNEGFKTPAVERFYMNFKTIVMLYNSDKKITNPRLKNINHYFTVLIQDKLDDIITNKMSKNEIEQRRRETRRLAFW